MAGSAGFYSRPQEREGLYDTAKRKFNENLEWSGEPKIGTPAPTVPPLQAPTETINPFKATPSYPPSEFVSGKPGRSLDAGFSESKIGATSEVSRSTSRGGARGITPGLRAGADRIASEIGDRPDIGAYATGLLEDEHQGRLAQIGANDPYERARGAERQADVDRLLSEDTSLVDSEKDPGISLVNGVYRTTRKAPRQSGAERKKSLEQQRQAGFAYDKAGAAEQQKQQTEQARRSSYLKATTQGLDAKYEQKAQQLQETLKGDQLRTALEKLNEMKQAEFNDSVTNAFQIGARFDLK